MEISSKLGSGNGRRLRGRKADTAKRRGEPDFLTATFAPIPAYEIPLITAACGKVDLTSLEDQARHLLDIYGKEYIPQRSGNDYKDVMSIHDDIRNQLGEKIDVELSEVGEDDDKHHEFFTCMECEGFPVNEVFFMPIRILETVDKELRDILILFFGFLERRSPFLLPKASYDVQYAIGILDEDDEEINEEQAECWSEDYLKLAERYVKGDINKLFKEIEDVARKNPGDVLPLAELIREKISDYQNPVSRNYKTPTGKELIAVTLLNCIEEGIDIHLEDNLFNYELRFIRYEIGDELFYDEIESDEIVDFDRLFMFTYGLTDDDDVAESVLNCFNQDMGNFSQTIMLDVHRVSAIDGKVEPSDYPKRWYQWFIKFLNCIYE